MKLRRMLENIHVRFAAVHMRVFTAYVEDDEILDRVNSMDIGSSTNNTTAQLNDLQKQLTKPQRSRSKRRLRKRWYTLATLWPTIDMY